MQLIINGDESVDVLKSASRFLMDLAGYDAVVLNSDHVLSAASQQIEHHPHAAAGHAETQAPEPVKARKPRSTKGKTDTPEAPDTHEAPPAVVAPPAQHPADAPVLTRADMLVCLGAVNEKKSLDRAIAVLKSFKVDRISQLPETEYAAFKAECDRALAE